MCGKDIEKSICGEMSGNVESGMVAVGGYSTLIGSEQNLQPFAGGKGRDITALKRIKTRTNQRSQCASDTFALNKMQIRAQNA